MADPLDQYRLRGPGRLLDPYAPTALTEQTLREAVPERMPNEADERTLTGGTVGRNRPALPSADPAPTPPPFVQVPATAAREGYTTRAPGGDDRPSFNAFQAGPSERGLSSWLVRQGIDPRTAANVASASPWTPMGAGYDIGHDILGPALQTNDPALAGLGAGLTAAAALPLGIRPRVPVRPPVREVTPVTGHTVGSLRLPLQRNVDPRTGLYSAADEAAHSYPRAPSPQSTTDPSRAGIIGTAAEVRRWMSSQGVTAAEMQHRNLNQLFADPQRTLTRQELLQHLADNPVQLQTARYQGIEPEDTRLVAMSRAETTDGTWEHLYEDRGTGRQFTLIEDPDAGNISVRNDQGQWLEVPGRINNQRVRDGVAAMENWLQAQAVPAGARGAARHPDWSLSGNTNPTYREDVLYAPPAYTPPQLREQAALQARHRDLVRRADEAMRTGAPMAEQEALNRELADVRAAAGQHRLPPGFVDSHYPDQQNPIGWIRSSEERAYPLGARPGEPNTAVAPIEGLLWDELQMPMAQRIRDQGARNEARVAELQARIPALSEAASAAEREAREFLNQNGVRGEIYAPRGALSHLQQQYGPRHPVGQEAARLDELLRQTQGPRDLAVAELATANRSPPSNAFVNDPHQALRTLMHYGLADPRLQDRRFGGIFLTPGQMQNERYNLARHVEALAFAPRDGRPFLNASGEPTGVPTPLGMLYYRAPGYSRDNWTAQRAIRDRAELDAYIGRDVAERLLSAPRGRIPGGLSNAHMIDNLSALEVGGRGMRENYDRIYPDTLDAILRRLDPQYQGRQQVYVRSSPMTDTASWYGTPTHYFPLTDRIREQLARGLPYFMGAGLAGGSVLDQYNRPPEE